MRALLTIAVTLAAAAAAPAASAHCREAAVEGEAPPAEWTRFLEEAMADAYLTTGELAVSHCGVPVEGYKAGLTTQAAQRRFGADGPLLGVLFRGTVLPDKAEIAVAGVERPMWEADFLFVVGNPAINAAATREEALAALRGFRPFIEVAALPSPSGAALTAADLRRANVAAWRGAGGPERSLAGVSAEALAAMRVKAFDGTGALVAEGVGADALGHPLDVVLWVRDQVRARGGRLKPGDVISVGAFTPLTAPKPGDMITVRYEGLPGDPEVSVRFR